MLGLLKYDRSFSGLSQCWSLDNTFTHENNNGFNQRKGYIFNADGAENIGKVSFAIDLEHIFGFAEDYDKVILGMRQVYNLIEKLMIMMQFLEHVMKMPVKL